MNGRFTIDGSDELERRLADLCQQVRSGILQIIPRSVLHAIVLGGGYGRGEGGVLSTLEGDRPYNDFECYLLTRGSDFLVARRYGPAVGHLAEKLSHNAGIEVELKLLGLRKLARSPVTMFYYDLISGHRLLEGDDSWLARCEHHRAAHRIPLHEATRLLMNRCSGLLFAQARLARPDFSVEDSDFVGRNLAKAKLAFGDVILTMRGQYHYSCRERHKRLKKLAVEKPEENLSSLVLLHEQGVGFKLHPIRTDRDASDLKSELHFLKETARELWLQLESRRLGRVFHSTEEYCCDPATKCAETRPLKNRLINARTYGLKEIVTSTYPRDRLLRSLPRLLWEEHSDRSTEAARKELRATSTRRDDLLDVYHALWKRFN